MIIQDSLLTSDGPLKQQLGKIEQILREKTQPNLGDIGSSFNQYLVKSRTGVGEAPTAQAIADKRRSQDLENETNVLNVMMKGAELGNKRASQIIDTAKLYAGDDQEALSQLMAAASEHPEEITPNNAASMFAQIASEKGIKPAYKAQSSVGKLAQDFKKGAITQDEYNAELSKIRKGDGTTVNVSMGGDKEFYKEYGGAIGKKMAEASGNIGNAYNAKSNVDRIMSEIASGTETGALDNPLKTAGSFLVGFGAKDPRIVGPTASREVIQQATNQLVGQRLKEMVGSTQISDADRAFVERSVGGFGTTKEGNIKGLAAIKAMSDQQIEMDNIIRQAVAAGASTGQILNMQTEFLSKNNVQQKAKQYETEFREIIEMKELQRKGQK